MKKKLSLVLAIFTVVALTSLTACSGNNSPSDNGGNNPQDSVQSSAGESSDNSSETSSDNSSDNTLSEDNSSDNTSSEDNSSDDTSSEDNSSDDTSSEDNSSDDTSSEDNSSDDTSSEDSSSGDSSGDTKPVAPSEKGEAIAKSAYDMLGKPFVEGGYSAETGFDNSGLIYYALTSNGIDCPRGLTAQKEMGTEVTLENLEKGDIVFIKDGDSFFGGVYTGDDTLVFSPYPEQKVRTASLKSVYYIDNFLKAVRVG